MARKTIERNISYDSLRGVYYVCLDAGRDQSGKRCRCYRTTPTLREARKLLRAFRDQKDQGHVIRPTSQTLGQWLDYWLNEIIVPTRAATTVYGYRNIINNHVSPAMGRIPLQRLTPPDIQRYYSMLLREKGLSPNTIRRHHDLLAAALHAAVRQDILLYCPVDRVEPPKAKPVETRFYGAEDLRRLFELVQGTSLEVTARLAGALGLRREEICGLKWKQIDFDRRLIHIRQARTSAGADIIEKGPKNSSSTRTLYMSTDIYLILMRKKREQDARARDLGREWPDTGLVVVDSRGIPPTPNALSLAFSRFVKCSGLPPLTLHGLRHSFATVASQQGVPLFDIGKALGHSTPATTGKIYTHLTDRTHTSTLNRVADAVR